MTAEEFALRYGAASGVLVATGVLAEIAGVPLWAWAAVAVLIAVAAGLAWLVREYRAERALDRELAEPTAVPAPAPKLPARSRTRIERSAAA